MSKWYVVQVLSGQEKKVRKAILENRETSGVAHLVDDVVVPTENVSEVKSGHQRISEKKLWPGYMLVKMTLNDESWMYVKHTNGVIDFLGGGKPSPLSDGEVEQLLNELNAKKDSVVHKHNIEIGDKVKIIDGVFVNFVGIVTEVFHDKGRLSAMVSIFGRDTRVDDLEFWQVEKLPADAEIE